MSDTWGLTASMYWKCWSEDENQVLSPKIGSRQTIKSILKIFEFPKSDNMPLFEIQFRREARCRFWKFKNFKNTFDYFTAGNPEIGPIFGVSNLTHLHCKSTKAFNFCIFLYSYVNLFILWPIPSAKNTFLALKVVIWKLGRMGLERILYLGVCHKWNQMVTSWQPNHVIRMPLGVIRGSLGGH